jgi:hypothetical protein
MSERDSIRSLLPDDLEMDDELERIATLWSSYGYIYRLRVRDVPKNVSYTMISKSIHPPLESRPSESHLRKLLSYRIERWFYHNLASKLHEHSVASRLAQCHPIAGGDEGSLLLEDLAVDFPYPARGSLGLDPAQCVLRWLAGFHGCFWNVHLRSGSRLSLVPAPAGTDQTLRVSGVWAQGTYWYLDTRRDELDQTDAQEYHWLLPWIEKVRLTIILYFSYIDGYMHFLILSWQVNDAIKVRCRTNATLLHGDVKGANILFSHSPWARPDELADLRCALYDLQYVGVGLPTHDLVYFIGTTVSPSLVKTKEKEDALLRYYYDILVSHLSTEFEGHPAAAYEWTTFLRDWELSIVDWYRFMAGWGFWGNDDWIERRAREIVAAWEAREGEAVVLQV